MSNPADSKLATKLGTGNTKRTISELGAYQQIMQVFVNYVTTVGSIPSIPAHAHVAASVTNAANTAIGDLNSGFSSAQSTTRGLSSQIAGITDVINSASTFARHGNITIDSILASIKQYKVDKKSVDLDGLKSNLDRMVSNCERLKRSVKTAHTNTTAAIAALQAAEKSLNSDFTQLQEAIPSADGKFLNLSKLTETQAYNELQTSVNHLSNQISSLRTDISWLTFGEVSTGLIGGLIAVTNFWNPVGWVAAGLTAYGEVEMVGKKAQETAKLNTDLINISLTQDEQTILHPLYSIKNAVAQLSAGVNAAEGVNTAIESLSDNFTSVASDLETFLSDVTKAKSADDLKSDAEYVKSDYQQLEHFCNMLLNPLPAKTVSQSALANAKPA